MAECPESDYAQLLAQLRSGDREAFATIVMQWQESVFKIAYRIVASVADAADVRQSVFVKLLESPDRLPEPERFSAWIRRCTVNESLRLLRRKSVEQRAKGNLAVGQEMSFRHTPREQVINAEEVEQLRESLTQLKPDQRVQLALRFDEGMTFEQMAAFLNCPASTVKSQFARTIGQLRQLLSVPTTKSKV